MVATDNGSSGLRTRRSARLLGTSAALAAALLTAPAAAGAAPTAPAHPSDTTAPDLVSLLEGYHDDWVADAGNTLHGTVVDAATLQHDDQVAVWINQHATPQQQFLALQDAEYQNAAGTAYDQSSTVATGLGSVLGAAYLKGRQDGDLPLTSALINSTDGTTGAYVSTSAAKAFFSHPRPYLPSDPGAIPVAGDAAECAPAATNASSQQAARAGQPWADAEGDLRIQRVAPVTDTTHQFSPNDVTLDPGYGTVGLCRGGSFPSGHTTTAYEAGLTLATLVPELAPELLARASEAGNDRIVLGVHYPLDVIGGRIDGEAALAQRWSDPGFRTDVLEPARAELLAYFEEQTGHDLAWNVAHQQAYTSDPYGGAEVPGGSAQVVTDRRSAVDVYEERLTYGFDAEGDHDLPPSVPATASSLLLTTFPTLSDAQRTSVLAQTEIQSGWPLDATGTDEGSWQRLDLAAATSATALVDDDGDVHVLRTGGTAQVVQP